MQLANKQRCQLKSRLPAQWGRTDHIPDACPCAQPTGSGKGNQLQLMNLSGVPLATESGRSRRSRIGGVTGASEETALGKVNAMNTGASFDSWTAGQSYEHYMGRWSRMVAGKFLTWLDAPTNADWLELGCGTGALTSTVLRQCSPRSILATDASEDFIAHTRQALVDPRLDFRTASAEALPADDASVDVVTSGLVFNFVHERPAALCEMLRVLRPGGLLSFYVWDYPGGGVGFIDAFWKAAASLDPEAAELDEGLRFPFCSADGLAALCAEAGIDDPDIAQIEIKTDFPDFEAFWHPFTLGSGPAPGYCLSLPAGRRVALKALLKKSIGHDGVGGLRARAWAVKARRPS